MLYQVIITAGLFVFLVNLALNLKSLKKVRADSKVPDSKPLVSVMVPARDEEANIRNCLESLRKQDYPNYEVLVLDDNSIDRTAEIVSEIAAEDDRIRLIMGGRSPKAGRASRSPAINWRSRPGAPGSCSSMPIPPTLITCCAVYWLWP
jgi:chlorobactene glucosyltransferase